MGQSGGIATAPLAFLGPLLESRYCADEVARIAHGISVRRATTLRANTLRSSAAEVEKLLEDAGLPYSCVPWYKDAFVLDSGSEGVLRSLKGFEGGWFYIQSLSSMLPPLALRLADGVDVLDMCAAPGGKTTQIAALSGGRAHVTACEMNVPRAEKLSFNLERQGARNVVVMRQDARLLDDFFSFDRILLDAPCTGSGTAFVGDLKLHKRLTPQLLHKCMKRQRALLAKAFNLVKPGGYVVYSTCSVLKEENEDIVRQVLKKGFELVPFVREGVESIPTLTSELEHVLTVCPDEHYEGFFLAVLRRVSH